MNFKILFHTWSLSIEMQLYAFFSINSGFFASFAILIFSYIYLDKKIYKREREKKKVRGTVSRRSSSVLKVAFRACRQETRRDAIARSGHGSTRCHLLALPRGHSFALRNRRGCGPIFQAAYPGD